MYNTNCGFCGKPMKAFAKDKRGTLPVVYCTKACEANAKEEKRYISPNRFK